MRATLLRLLGPEGDLETVDAWRAAQVPAKAPLLTLPPEHLVKSLQWLELPAARERYLRWVAEWQAQRHAQRQDEAVRATLLEQAREVLVDLPAEVGGDALARLGVERLDECDEAQLKAIVVLGRGGGQ